MYFLSKYVKTCKNAPRAEEERPQKQEKRPKIIKTTPQQKKKDPKNNKNPVESNRTARRAPRRAERAGPYIYICSCSCVTVVCGTLALHRGRRIPRCADAVPITWQASLARCEDHLGT